MLVKQDNFDEVMQEIQKFSHLASFASIDCEFTGCGTNKQLYDRDLEQKYEAIRSLVNGHSIISLGLTYWFQDAGKPDTTASSSTGRTPPRSNNSNYVAANNETRYRIRSFTFLLAIADEFVSTPSALKFLVEHGFDFNLLFTAGISYQRAKGTTKSIPGTFHYLFSQLKEQDIPLVFHNGLLDVAFIYRSFFGELPAKVETFVSSIMGWFPSIYDTKYIASFHMNETTSYLEYLFKKSARENEANKANDPNAPCFTISNPLNLKDNFRKEKNADICTFFAASGFCKAGSSCKFSHSVSLVLDRELSKKEKNAEKKRKKKNRNNNNNPAHVQKKAKTVDCNDVTQNVFLASNFGDMCGFGKKSNKSKSTAPKPNATFSAALEELTHFGNGFEDLGVPLNEEATMQSCDQETKPEEINLKTEDLSTVAALEKNSVLDEKEQNGDEQGQEENAHSAGYDSFATGYIFAHYSIVLGSAIKTMSDKIHLTGGLLPLTLCKSIYLSEEIK